MVDDKLIYEGIRSELDDFAAFAHHVLVFLECED